MADSEKLPWSTVAPIVLTVYSYFFSMHVVMPFLPFMTKGFLDRPRNEIGYFVGFLASSYFVGDFFGTVFWGRIADRSGRRKVMLISPALTGVLVLAFGCSRSFTWAVIARLLWGFSSSVVSVAKTMLADVATDSTQARLFAMMGVGNGLARLSAPALGGLLSEPARKFPLMDTELFRNFPYLLPCLVGVGLTSVNLCLNFFFLKETLHMAKKKESEHLVAPVEDDEDEIRSSGNGNAMHVIVLEEGARTTDTTSLISDSNDEEADGDHIVESVSTGGKVVSKLRSHRRRLSIFEQLWLGVRRHFQAYRLLKSPLLAWPLAVYALLAFTSMVTFEVLPLLLINTSEHGGFCLNSAEIGILYAATGVVQLANQLIVYPLLAKRFGFRQLFRFMHVLFFCSILLLPWAVRITGPQDPPPLEVINGTVVDNKCSSGFLAAESDVSGYSNFSANADVDSMSFKPVSGDCYAPRDYYGNSSRISDSLSAALSDEFAVISCVPWWVYVSLVCFSVPLTVSIIMSFTSANIMTNNSCTSDIRATVNGIGQSFASIGRFLGPLVGVLFAWSTTSGLPFPLNYHLTFVVVAIVVLINIYLSFHLTSNVEQRMASNKKEAPINGEERRQLVFVVNEDEVHADREVPEMEEAEL